MLNRAQMRNLTGGDYCPEGYLMCGDGTCVELAEDCTGHGGPGGGGDGRCVVCECNGGSNTCWYSRRSSHDLCVAVCGSSYFSVLDPVNCVTSGYVCVMS